LTAAREEFRAGRWAEAFTIARKRLSEAPGDPAALALGALCLFRLGQPQAAEDFARQIPIDQYPLAELEARGDILVALNWWPPAVEVFSELVRRQPKNPRFIQRLAVLEFQVGNVPRARTVAEALIHFDDRKAAAHCLLGVIYEALEDEKSAIAHLERALELDPEGKSLPVSVGEVVQKLAHILMNAGRAAEARAYLEHQAGRQPTDDLLCELGDVLFALGELSESRRRWETALERTPNQPRALIGLASLDLLEGRPQRALEKLQRVSDSGTETVALHYSFNRAYAQLGDATRAKFHADRAEQVRAKFEQLDQREQILLGAPDQPYVHVLRAEKALEMGDFKEAAMYLLEASRRMPNDPRVRELVRQLRTLQAQQGSERRSP
jgi:type IV pilus assembly protein PilF